MHRNFSVVFWTVVPNPPAMETAVCHFLPRQGLSPPPPRPGPWHVHLSWRAWKRLWDSQKQVLPEGPGLSFSAEWCLWSGVLSLLMTDSLTCDFLGNITIKYAANCHCLLMKVRQHGVHSALCIRGHTSFTLIKTLPVFAKSE